MEEGEREGKRWETYVPFGMEPGSMKVARKKLAITKKAITPWTMVTAKWYLTCRSRHLRDRGAKGQGRRGEVMESRWRADGEVMERRGRKGQKQRLVNGAGIGGQGRGPGGVGAGRAPGVAEGCSREEEEEDGGREEQDPGARGGNEFSLRLASCHFTPLTPLPWLLLSLPCLSLSLLGPLAFGDRDSVLRDSAPEDPDPEARERREMQTPPLLRHSAVVPATDRVNKAA